MGQVAQLRRDATAQLVKIEFKVLQLGQVAQFRRDVTAQLVTFKVKVL